MQEKLPQGLHGEQVAKRMLWLAWEACGMPLGMGWLHDKKDATEDDVWQAVSRMPHELYADYLFGRMVKLGIQWDDTSVSYSNRTPRNDYQGWAGRYPSHGTLYDSAIATLQGREPPRVQPKLATRRTVNCVKCGKAAVSWSGHVVKYDGETVLAGSCRKCADDYYHSGIESVLRTMATGGCMGSWREEHGIQEDP